MYYSFHSYDDMKAFDGGKVSDAKKKGCLILVTMRGCPYCEIMKPEWRSFVTEHQNSPQFNIIEVESTMINPIASRDRDLLPLSTLAGFPTISFRRPDTSQIEFKDARTKPKLLKFVKDSTKKEKESTKKESTKKESAKKESAKKESAKKGSDNSGNKMKESAKEGIYLRGDKKGQLKKGYRYVNGKPEKAEKK